MKALNVVKRHKIVTGAVIGGLIYTSGIAVVYNDYINKDLSVPVSSVEVKKEEVKPEVKEEITETTTVEQAPTAEATPVEEVTKETYFYPVWDEGNRVWVNVE